MNESANKYSPSGKQFAVCNKNLSKSSCPLNKTPFPINGYRVTLRNNSDMQRFMYKCINHRGFIIAKTQNQSICLLKGNLQK